MIAAVRKRRIARAIPTTIGPPARASLPMYDLPALRPATDRWWAGIALACRDRGVADAPPRLDRGDPVAAWRDPGLLISQCCGRDLVTHLAGIVVPVAIPVYDASGCVAGDYRSWLVARRDDRRSELAAFVGSAAAINYIDSHSGWVALAHACARAGLPERCFARGLLTGSHAGSLAAVARGSADLAAIDCVSFALLAHHEPALTAGLRIFGESEPAPALPYVTAAHRPRAERARLAEALLAAAATERLQPERAALRLRGFVLPEGDPYRRTAAMAAAALRQPCTVLG